MTKDASQSLKLEPDEVPFLDRKEAEALGVTLFTAHWSIFNPTVLLAVVFACIWYALGITGQSGTYLGRFFIVAMAVLWPLLAATAFLRYQTTRLQIDGDAIAVHTGNLMSTIEQVDVSRLRSASYGRSAFGGGTLYIELEGGEIITLRSLSQPETARDAVLERVSPKQQAG